MHGTISMDERRGHRRCAVSFAARVFGEGRLVLSGRTLDVSLGGALLHGHARLDVGQAVRVEVPRGGSRNPLVMNAQVVRIESPTAQIRRHGLALRWIDDDVAAVAALVSLLREHDC